MRLNDCQQIMIRWDELHAYNALDVVEIRRPITANEVQLAAEQERLLHGLGPVRLDRSCATCTFQPDAASVVVETVEPLPGETAPQTLERHMAAELNRRFRWEHDVPFRLAVLRCEPFPFVCFTYHHWLCDGVTGSYLFRRILARLLGVSLDREPRWTFADAPNDRTLYAHGEGWPRKRAVVWELIREVFNGNCIYSPCRPGPLDPTVDVHLIDSPPDVLRRLQRCARETAATVNEVLMAVFARAADAALPERLQNRWRRALTVASIANMRPLAGDFLQHVAGNHLGFLLMHCRGELPRRFPDLVRLLRRQSARVKAGRFHLTSILGFRLGRMLLPLVPSRWRAEAARTAQPVTVGLSNLRYPADWYGSAWSDLLGTYWRAVPTGLSSPLNFGLTTVHDAMTIQLTAHRSGYDPAQVQTVRKVVEAGLSELAP
jgi:hypothetical protein